MRVKRQITLMDNNKTKKHKIDYEDLLKDINFDDGYEYEIYYDIDDEMILKINTWIEEETRVRQLAKYFDSITL